MDLFPTANDHQSLINQLLPNGLFRRGKKFDSYQTVLVLFLSEKKIAFVFVRTIPAPGLVNAYPSP